MLIRTANFVCSSPDFRSCPAGNFPDVAFIGRSNVGKSSLINMLAGKKGLAKVSGTPGKTRLINHFLVNEQWYIVDLPGYGFAKMSKDDRAKMEKMIAGYLMNRKNLLMTFVLIDSRLAPQAIDIEFMTWLNEMKLSFMIIFTKTDKLTKNQLNANTSAYKRKLASVFSFPPEIILTSSETKAGKEELLHLIGEIVV
jgi:GTP-binding protein